MECNYFILIMFIIMIMSILFITVFFVEDIISYGFSIRLLAGIAVIFMVAFCFIEIKLEKSTLIENKIEIQEIISQETSRGANIWVTYKDLSGDTKEVAINKTKTSEEDILYSYIETKTYKWGFLYKDVNTLYLKR